ncbi:hypothetical protein ACFZBU_30890 [Embleya sp. NPDC008237]|uniref:hypothetical protein n=1 Tax=Embleya sp. NPDC008237 TaxID=3363978 RepID=UPI0036E6C17D
MAHSIAIPGGPPPFATLKSYVTDHRSDTVTVLDVVTGTALATIDVPGAHGVAAVPGGSVYVTSPEHGVITVIDTEMPVVLGRIAADRPHLPVVAPDGSAVYFVSHPADDDQGSGSNTVEVLSPTLNTVVRSHPLPASVAPSAPAAPGARVTSVAVAPGGGRLYLGMCDTDSIAGLDLATGATVVGTTRAPRGVACSPDGAALYVAGAAGVHILDAATLGSLGTIAIDGGATDVAVAPDGSRLYVVPGDARDLWIVDPLARAVIGSVDTPNAGAVEVTSGGTRAVVIGTAAGDGVVVSIVDSAGEMAGDVGGDTAGDTTGDAAGGGVVDAADVTAGDGSGDAVGDGAGVTAGDEAGVGAGDAVPSVVALGRGSFRQAFVGSAGALPVARPASWAAPTDLGGTTVGLPGMAIDRHGRASVFGHDAGGHHVWSRTEQPDGEWTPWVDLGEPIDGAPVAARSLDGRIMVFFRAEEHALRLLRRAADDVTWLAGQTLADNLVGDPIVGFGASGRPEVFYEGTDGALWHVWSDTADPEGRWSGAERLGGDSIAGIAGVRDGEGRQVVVHVTTSGRVWSIRQQGPDGYWEDFEHAFDGAMGDRAPTLAVRADGRVQVVALGNDGALWASTRGKDGWSEPEPLPGGVGGTDGDVGGVRAIGAGDGRVVVVVGGADGRLWVSDQTGPEGDEWNEFVSLAADSASGPVRVPEPVPVPVLDESGCLRIAWRAADEGVRVVGQARM